MTDANGKKSTTIFFVRLGGMAVIVKYIFASFAIPMLGVVPSMSTVDFGVGLTAILAIWQVREYRNNGGSFGMDKTKNNG